MPYLIDSDWVIDHLDEVPTATQLLIDLQGNQPVFISMVTYMEVFQGTLHAPNPAGSLTRLRDFIERAPVLPFDEAVAERCARIREVVRGGQVRANRRAHDLMIAATAIENGLILVTRNVNDFADVPDLVLYRP